MSLAEPGFKPVKPHGNIGDRKNDGYIEATQTYYQVYAPENLSKSHAEATQKLRRDFDGLKRAWPMIRKFYFVLNDKYKGPYPDAAQDITALNQQHEIEKADILLAKDLENIAFSKLDDDALLELVNFPPDPATLPHLDFSILNEVITHIMKMPSKPPDYESLVVPEWDQKMAFNGLGDLARSYLNAAAFKVGFLEEYLNNQGYLATQELRNRMVTLYDEAKGILQEERTEPEGDDVFFQMLKKGSPKQQAPYNDAFLVVLAKYFEACDVFDRPEDE